MTVVLQQPYKRMFSLIVLFILCFLWLPLTAFADQVENRTVVTLGQDLSQEQRSQVLKEMGIQEEEAEILFVTIEEERQYLGDHFTPSEIGSRSISSVNIRITDEGSGIQIETNNITRITETMYANALETAGVQDAKVYVTAPFPVSGTAALTGILKAFEVAAGEEISEEQKQVANEEMAKTAKLADKIGAKEAAALIARLKEALGEAELETDEDYRQLVLTIAAELNVNLSDEDVDALVHLLKRIKGLNMNWDQIGNQLKNIRNNLGDFLSREETKNFLQKFIDLLLEFIEQFKNLFSS